MTAAGKVTTARLTRGDRIMVKDLGDGRAWPSYTKIKDATAAEVTDKRLGQRDRYDRRTPYTLELRTDDGRTLTINRSAPSQTYWRAN